MIIVGLDGKTHKWNLKYKEPTNRCSKLHRRARNLLKKIFPFEIIHEEVVLPGSKTSRRSRVLRSDFYIPRENLMIEVQGSQHYQYSSRFHNTKMDFLDAQARDRDKRMWCELNHIQLIELPFNENNKDWTDRINEK